MWCEFCGLGHRDNGSTVGAGVIPGEASVSLSFGNLGSLTKFFSSTQLTVWRLLGTSVFPSDEIQLDDFLFVGHSVFFP